MTHQSGTILDAITAGDIDKARQLIREALADKPSAEIYYLAARVALNDSQRIEFLKKTLELDPFHLAANNELSQVQVPPAAPPPPVPSAAGFQLPSDITGTDTLVLAGALVLFISFLALPWLEIFGTSINGVGLLGEEAGVFLVFVGTIGAVLSAAAAPRLGLNVARVAAAFSGALAVLFFIGFFIADTNSSIRASSIVGIGFWLSLLAAILLVAQVFIPRPTEPGETVSFMTKPAALSSPEQSVLVMGGGLCAVVVLLLAALGPVRDIMAENQRVADATASVVAYATRQQQQIINAANQRATQIYRPLVMQAAADIVDPVTEISLAGFEPDSGALAQKIDYTIVQDIVYPWGLSISEFEGEYTDFVAGATIFWDDYNYNNPTCGFFFRKVRDDYSLVSINRLREVTFETHRVGEDPISQRKVSLIIRNEPNETNKILLIGIGGEVLLYINGEFVARYNRAMLPSGQVALLADQENEGDHCSFANAWLWRIDNPAARLPTPTPTPTATPLPTRTPVALALVGGEWNGTLVTGDDRQFTFRLKIEQNGEILTGTSYIAADGNTGTMNIEGTVNGGSIYIRETEILAENRSSGAWCIKTLRLISRADEGQSNETLNGRYFSGDCGTGGGTIELEREK